MLEQEQLLYHVRKAKQGEENSKSILFKENAPLIKSLVNRFKNKGVEQEDLYQIACIGFLKAINNFDENFGVKFSTYSVPMVIGEIKRYMRDNGAIKVSRTLKILANKINRYVDEFVSNKGVSPTVEHLSNVFSVPEEEVVIAMDSSKMPLSIYEKYEDEEDGQELIDKIFDGEQEEKMIDKIHLKDLLSRLDFRERKIIIMRYYRDRTQSEIASSLGVSQVQVSRLENKIIDKIRLEF